MTTTFTTAATLTAAEMAAIIGAVGAFEYPGDGTPALAEADVAAAEAALAAAEAALANFDPASAAVLAAAEAAFQVALTRHAEAEARWRQRALYRATIGTILVPAGNLPPMPEGYGWDASQLAAAVAHHLHEQAKRWEHDILNAAPDRAAFIAGWLSRQPDELGRAVQAAEKALKRAKMLTEVLAAYQRLLG